MKIWNKVQKISHMDTSQAGAANGYEQAKV